MIRIIQIIFVICTVWFLVSCNTGSTIIPNKQSQKDNLRDDSRANPKALQHFMDGQLLMTQGNHARAILKFQDALRYDSDVSTIHFSLGKCFWFLEKPDRAEFHLEKALQLEPDDIEARIMLARQFINRGMFDHSKKHYAVLAEANPKNVEYILALAELSKIQLRYNDAIQFYEKAFAMNPNVSEPLEKAAELTLKTKQFEKAQHIFKQLILTDKTNLLYLENYSDIAILNDDKSEGIWALEQIAKRKESPVDVLNQVGLLYFEMGEIDSALFEFNQVYKLDSLNIFALHFLSQIYRVENNLVKAHNFANQLISLHPDEPKGYINSALAYLNQENYKEVISILSSKSELFKEEFTIQYLLGLSYNLNKNLDMAEKHLRQALTVNPKSRIVLHSLAIIYDKTVQWVESDSIYTELIQSDSTDAQALNNYSYSLVERGEKLDFALSLSKKAILLSPESSAYLDTYGWIHYKIGNIDSAEIYIKKSVELEDTNTVVLEHLGDVLISKSEFEEAIIYFYRALELNPDNTVLRKKLSDL